MRVFKWLNDAWTQKGADIDGLAPNDTFGISVSISGNGSILAVGTPNNDIGGIDAGHVRVFEWLNDTWNQRGGNVVGDKWTDFSNLPSWIRQRSITHDNIEYKAAFVGCTYHCG